MAASRACCLRLNVSSPGMYRKISPIVVRVRSGKDQHDVSTAKRWMRCVWPSLRRASVNKENSVPVWLLWMRSLPMPMRIWLARRWQRIAGKRLDWAEYIAPELKDEDSADG